MKPGDTVDFQDQLGRTGKALITAIKTGVKGEKRLSLSVTRPGSSQEFHNVPSKDMKQSKQRGPFYIPITVKKTQPKEEEPVKEKGAKESLTNLFRSNDSF